MASINKASRFLAYVMRHKPDEIGLSLSKEGWAAVGDVLRGMRQHGFDISRDTLTAIVAQDTKGRYSFDADGRRIRANHGHSVSVLAGDPVEPPPLLYHGTASRTLDAIKQDGIVAISRQYVHLSGDIEQATAVGRRHGTPVVIPVAAKSMHDAGHAFHRTASNVWLTLQVPIEYLDFTSLVW